MKYALVLALGIVTGLAFSRIPHYVGPIFNDLPRDPDDWSPKTRYWNGGVETPILAWPPAPVRDDKVFIKVALP